MKKILWLSDVAFSPEKIKVTGTWIIAMGKALMESGEVSIFNVTHGNVKEVVRYEVDGIVQWILPNEKMKRNELPSLKTQHIIREIEEEIQPDLVHIWGTENYWGKLVRNGTIKSKTLLEIQGILYAYAEVYYGGLNLKEILACIGLKELLLPQRFLYFRKKDFETRGRREIEIIKNSTNIAVQSEWVKAHINYQNPQANIYSSGMLLREEFYQSDPWQKKDSHKKIIFTTLSGANSYKGLHVLIKALAVLKTNNTNIELQIGSNMLQRKYPIYDGYILWLFKLIKKLGLTNSIIWLGSLNAQEIINKMQDASVFVIPSYIETYCLALAEAMMVGIPTVVSYAGAMPELAVHNKSTLFFPVGDYVSCAQQIEKLFLNNDLCNEISMHSRLKAFDRNNPEMVISQQISIYNSIINK